MKDICTHMLEALINLYGTDILTDAARLKQAMAEVFRSDEYKKPRNLLGIALLDLNAYARLKSLSGGEFMAADVLASQMHADFDIASSSAQEVMEAVAKIAGTTVLQITHPVAPIISPPDAAKPRDVGLPLAANLPVITFGNHHWLVLKSVRRKLLVITQNAVAIRDWPNRVLSVHNFDLRRYLNTDFLGAFTADDRKLIIRDDSKHETVFLLNCNEAELYFNTDADRAASYQGENCICWLTDGYIQPSGAIVAYPNKLPVFDSDKMPGGIRPAMWIKK